MADQYVKKICAGIVLYNPEIDLLKKNIEAIADQVDCIYLFDNGSKNHEELCDLQKSYKNMYYEYDPENKGIAHGLNMILAFADVHGYEWFLSMDQDSICSSNMIEVYSKYMDDESNGLITPFILNNGKRTVESYKSMDLPEFEYIEPINAITSACLSRVSAVKEVGGFPEEFFIDFVDIDLNCRIAMAGYNVVRANEAYLIQRMGEAKHVPLFAFLYKLTKIDLFRKAQTASVYGDIRLYYSARNSYVVHKRYSNAGIKATPFSMCMNFCYYSIAYPRDRSRIKMWKSVIKGFRDGRKMWKNSLSD